MKKDLSSEDIKALRNAGKITNDEIAYCVGDLIIAENVIKGDKRVLSEVDEILQETKRRLLKG